jgi:hypothetical protein
VQFFREAAPLLQNWSISKLLSFGAHLYLLELSIGPLKEELSSPIAQRVDAVVRNSRAFVNSFEEWHAYVRQSIVLDIEVGEQVADIVATTKAVAATLADSQDSVDPEIPNSLDEFAKTASDAATTQGVAVGIMSALRSFTNISISFVEYVVSRAKSIGSILRNSRTWNLIGAICRFYPLIKQLAITRPNYAWLLSYDDEIRAVCDQLKKET